MKLGRKLLWFFLFIVIGTSISGMVLMTRNSEGELNWKTHDEAEAEAVRKEAEKAAEVKAAIAEAEQSKEGTVKKPDIDEQLLTVNKWSRPGTKTKEIKYIVVHYLGNAGTTAQENRDYFESLKDLQNVSMSANFIVGLDGEIIECIPDGEIAYASNSANKESISIENCNVDSTGKFLQDTYISLVKLTAYLADKYELGRDGIIRHYDVTGKDCPLYYVENEEAWEAFLDDVETYQELCKQNSPELEKLDTVLKGLEYTYKSKFDADIKTEKDSGKEIGKPHDYEDANENYSDDSDNEEETSRHDEAPVSDNGSQSDGEYYNNDYSNTYSESQDYNSEQQTYTSENSQTTASTESVNKDTASDTQTSETQNSEAANADNSESDDADYEEEEPLEEDEYDVSQEDVSIEEVAEEEAAVDEGEVSVQSEVE